MRTLFEYHPGDDCDTEYLHDLCERIMDRHQQVVKYGFFGAWDGPVWGGSLLTYPRALYGHVSQEFTVNMSIKLCYTEENETVRELQRYCDSTPVTVPANSLLLLQHHHDGCNQYIIRAAEGMDTSEIHDAKSFIRYCAENSADIDEGCL